MNAACCVSGSFDEGSSPKGKDTFYDGIPVYIATPTSSTPKLHSAIVIAPDAFGFNSPNNKLISDSFANSTGCTVVLVDPFKGYALNPNGVILFGRKNSELGWFQFFSKYTQISWWLVRHAIPWVLWFAPIGRKTLAPNFLRVVKHLRESENVKRIVCVGYCIGGGNVLASIGSSENQDLIDAYAIIHPADFKPEQINKFKKPLLWVACEIDESCPPAMRAQVELNLSNLQDAAFRYRYFPSVQHGFAVRGDLKDETTKKARQQCFTECVNWFLEYLPKD